VHSRQIDGNALVGKWIGCPIQLAGGLARGERGVKVLPPWLAGEDSDLTNSQVYPLKMKPFRCPRPHTTSGKSRKTHARARTPALKRNGIEKRAVATVRFATVFLVILCALFVTSAQARQRHRPAGSPEEQQATQAQTTLNERSDQSSELMTRYSLALGSDAVWLAQFVEMIQLLVFAQQLPHWLSEEVVAEREREYFSYRLE
jgi:hypothetical protein